MRLVEMSWMRFFTEVMMPMMVAENISPEGQVSTEGLEALSRRFADLAHQSRVEQDGSSGQS